MLAVEENISAKVTEIFQLHPTLMKEGFEHLCVRLKINRLFCELCPRANIDHLRIENFVTSQVSSSLKSIAVAELSSS